MTFLPRLTRPFREKATGVMGFKYCVGDDVVAKIDDEFLSVKVLYLFDNLDGYYTAGVKGIDEHGSAVRADVFSGNVYDPNIAKFIGKDVAVEAEWPTNGTVKANITDIDNKGLLTVADQKGHELLVTANCIKNLEDVDITHDTFTEPDASCFAPTSPEV